MRLTLDSTDETATIVVSGTQVPARLWLGTTEQGNRVGAFITRIAPLSIGAAIELEISLFDVTAQTTTVIESGYQLDTLERDLFAWLARKYVGRTDERQRSLGLQYMEAETHDLAAELAKFFQQRSQG